MTNAQIAQQFAANLRDLQAGRITADEARARNRALREQNGEDSYTAGKHVAIAAIANGKA